MLHEEAHSRGKAARVFTVPTPEQWRALLPGHNSVAWNVWHIARGEDWGVNTMLRGHEQVLTRDGWDARMGVRRRDFGLGMTTAEVADLSAAIDLDALRGYYAAVTEETRRFAQVFDFDTLDEPVDLDACRALAPEGLGPDEPLRMHIARWTRRSYLNVMTLMDVYYHLDEADHMIRMLLPDRRFI
jgi:hypothetical protein